MTTVNLRIIAWEDPRCELPLECATDHWIRKTGIQVSIRRRPLTAFNDQLLLELSPDCDLMIVDYPHMTKALSENAIVPIEDLVDSQVIEEIGNRAIGRSQESFVVGDVTSGFASDAACHVAAYRHDLLIEFGTDPPTTWEEVFALQEDVPGSVALGLYHTDALSCLLSMLAANEAGPEGNSDIFQDKVAAVAAVECLSKLVSGVEDFCWQSTPRDIFMEAESRSRIAYIPLTFGYVGRTAPENGGWRFGPPPQGCGSILGGAGMAVSSLSPEKKLAAEFASWYCRDEGQLLAGRNGGQPAGLAAWEDPCSNTATDEFFYRTRKTQETAWVRPLTEWWPSAQKETGVAFADLLRRGTSPEIIVDELEKIYGNIRRQSLGEVNK